MIKYINLVIFLFSYLPWLVFQYDEIGVTPDDLFDDIDGMDDQMLAATADGNKQDSDGEANMDEVEKFLFDENSKGMTYLF